MEKVCYICHENEKDNDLETLNKNYFPTCDCNIYYHKKCIDKWFQYRMTCPVCKKEVETSYILSFFGRISPRIKALCILPISLTVYFTMLATYPEVKENTIGFDICGLE